MQHHFTTAPPNGLDLDPWRRCRHDDHRPTPHLGRRQGNALGVVAGGSANHPALELFWRKTGNLVVSAANLEGKNGLHVLALEPDFVVDPLGKVVGEIERRLADNIVNLGIEDFFEIIRVHLAWASSVGR